VEGPDTILGSDGAQAARVAAPKVARATTSELVTMLDEAQVREALDGARGSPRGPLTGGSRRGVLGLGWARGKGMGSRE